MRRSATGNGVLVVKHWTTYPLIAHPYNPEFVSGENLARFARAAEALRDGIEVGGSSHRPGPLVLERVGL